MTTATQVCQHVLICLSAILISVCNQVLAAATPASDTVVGRTLEAPVNTRSLGEKFWWSNEWYEQGILPTPSNHEVVERQVAYVNPVDGTEVPAILYRPATPGKFPGVLFQHGRRGLDDLTLRHPRRESAGRGVGLRLEKSVAVGIRRE